MASFEKALPTVFAHEGRYSMNPSDPGGATMWGISLRFLYTTGDLDKDGWPDGDINHDGKIDVNDIKQMKEEDAANLYKLYFWDKNNYEYIEYQDIATKIFDFAVNMGSYVANLVAQRAVRAAIGLKLDTDGIMGRKTILAINMAKPDVLMAAIKAEAAGYYRSIKYQGSKDFITGWLNRSYSNVL